MNALSHRTSLTLAAIIASTAPAAAANFSLIHDAIDSGGGRSTSARFEIISSVNPIAPAAPGISTTFADRRGYIGQINEFPLLLPDQFVVRPNRPQKIFRANLLANDTDADDSLLRFVSIPSVSANGVPLSLIDDNWILYDAPRGNTLADTFTYIVTDGIDQSIGRVFLLNSLSDEITLNIALLTQGADKLLYVFGIPGHTYQVQTTSSLTSPTWTNLGPSQIIPANGVFQRLDIAPPSTRFYRAIEP